MSLTIVDVVIDSFAVNANKVVVRQNDVVKTYSDLHHTASTIATYLVKNGLNKGDRVALLFENSFEYVAIYYAILMSGGVVVSLNSSAKSNDLINWIKHSGAIWLFASGKNNEVKSIVSNLKNEIQYVISGSHKLGNIQTITCLEDVISVDTEFSRINIDGSDIAAIIYTSGTTGRPKGVTLTHTNLLSNMQSIINYLPIKSTDICLNVLPFYYSFGNSILHTHIMVGATLILENSFLFPQAVLKKMQDEKVTSFSGVPSTFALILNRTNLSDFDLSAMRYMTQAGGAMLPAHIERLRRHLPDLEFVVMYGQTEATARLTYLPYEELNNKTASVGKPIPGVSIQIRDENGMSVVNGKTGEIFATGSNIMKGYWNDPELTSSVVNNGWLKTGDLARQDADGYIYIVGRKTEMIKSGAHRISPLDIEESILRCDGVAEVAVIGLADEILGQVIKAFVVTKEGIKVEKRNIQLHCKNNLAAYKIPKKIEFIDELPKTASGKLKRFELHNIN